MQLDVLDDYGDAEARVATVKYDPYLMDASRYLIGTELPHQPCVFREVAFAAGAMQRRPVQMLTVECDRDGIIGRVVVKVDLKLDARIVGDVVVHRDMKGRTVSREGSVQGHGDLAKQTVVALSPIADLLPVPGCAA